MKFDVKYVEFFGNEEFFLKENLFMNLFNDKLHKYASGTSVFKIREDMLDDLILKLTLQKSLSLNTLNSILISISNDDKSPFVIENINFEYINSKLKIKVKVY